MLTLNQRLRQIGLAYQVFLKNNDIVDGNLPRMTYFSAVKKMYIDIPVEDEDEQHVLIQTLNAWLGYTEKAMNDTMLSGVDKPSLGIIKNLEWSTFVFPNV